MSKLLSTTSTLLLIFIAVGCAGQPKPVTTAGAQGATVTLTVGLYPWVPRPQQIQDAVEEAWAAANPDVALSFTTSTEWDGGYDIEPTFMDVFVYDATFIDYFRTQNYISPLTPAEVDNVTDYLSYAIDGAQDGGNYYGMPVYGCANILYYRDDDVLLAAATKLSDVTAAIGQCSFTSQVPPDERGLLVDMSGGTTSACLYADMVESTNGQWPIVLPTDPSQLNATVITESQTMLATSSYYNGTTSLDDAYQRAVWFSQGGGRALMAFTEAMSSMSTSMRATVQFKPFPLGEDPTAQPLFYSDMVAVGANTQQRALAVELANMIASTTVLLAGMQADGSDPPQYLMPVRTSLFTALEALDPIYTRMEAMVTAADPILFNLGVDARTFINNMKTPIQTAVRANYACGCDQDGGNLTSQGQADSTCPGVCSSYGGWNGQWTPYPPGATDEWQSGCGCKTCPGQ